MQRITTATRALNLFGAGKDGFKNGDLANGIAPTDFNAAWPNGLQEEVARVVEATGVALDGNKFDQLLTALRSNGLIYGVDTGAANACVVTTYDPAIPALVDGMVLWFKAKVTNTGATTLNVNGIGALPVTGAAHAALQGGEIVANGRCQVIYSATLNSWVLIKCTGAPLQVGAATQSQQAMQLGQATGRLLNFRVLNAVGATTYNAADPATKSIVLLLQAGGGGGGGAGTTIAGQASAGSGGGGGGWCLKRITAGFNGTSLTIGGGGAAGAGGGSSSFGAFCSATGGFGGSFGGASNISAGQAIIGGQAAGGVGSGGDVNGQGGHGLYGILQSNPSSGKGGSSYFGDGANWAYSTAGQVNGNSATVAGAGGSGGVNAASVGTNATGGSGSQGVALVWEYS